MKKWLGMALASTALSGCGLDLQLSGGPQVVGSGKVSSITRKLAAFKSVSVDGSIDADVTVGKSGDATIKGDDNLINLVKTEVKGDTLHIYLDGNYSTKNPLIVTLSASTLQAASVAGSGDLALHNVGGSEFDISIAGSGDIKADGSIGKLSARIAGSGDLELYGLKATDAKVSISGSGDASVFVTGTLNASITGSGDVKYKGHPQRVEPSIVGSGEVSAGE